MIDKSKYEEFRGQYNDWVKQLSENVNIEAEKMGITNKGYSKFGLLPIPSYDIPALSSKDFKYSFSFSKHSTLSFNSCSLSICISFFMALIFSFIAYILQGIAHFLQSIAHFSQGIAYFSRILVA